jgi:hypothetical protein
MYIWDIACEDEDGMDCTGSGSSPVPDTSSVEPLASPYRRVRKLSITVFWEVWLTATSSIFRVKS